MVDLKLKRITFRHWMKFQRVVLDFPDSGLVLVQGVNTASGGALLSVGSGKTGLGEVISRTLLGVSGRFTHMKQFSTDKSGNTYVRLEAELHGKPLVVEAGYRCSELSPSGEALRYTYDGHKIERGKIEQTRLELSTLLGVSPMLASWTAFIDGDSIKFNKLGQADSVELVMASLKQPPWNAYYEASKAKLGAFKRSAAQAEIAHKNATTALTTAQEDVEATRQKVRAEMEALAKATRLSEANIQRYTKAVNSKKQKIEEARRELFEIAAKLKKMEDDRAEASHKLEIKLHDIEDQITAAEQAREPLAKARDDAQKLTTEAKAAFTGYRDAGKNCPTCDRPLGKVDPKRLKILETTWAGVKNLSDKASAAWAVAEQTVMSLNVNYRETSKEHRDTSAKAQVDALADRNEELDQAVADATEDIHAWELDLVKFRQPPSDAALKTAEARLDDKLKALTEAKNNLDNAAELVVGDRATLQVLEYWNLAFSPYGIPNMVLTNAVTPLNKEARRLSAAITGGTIEVRYSTVRELSSGLSKAQLNIEVDNKLGDKDLTGSSKGEAGLTNFIIAETLSEVGQVSRRVGFRWYDEIVPHQDPKVCHSIYSYMKETASRLGILVFLVDHNPIAANYADHVLVVEKKAEAGRVTSSIHWR